MRKPFPLIYLFLTDVTTQFLSGHIWETSRQQLAKSTVVPKCDHKVYSTTGMSVSSLERKNRLVKVSCLHVSAGEK